MTTEIVTRVRDLHISLAPKPRAKAAPVSSNFASKTVTSSFNHKKHVSTVSSDPMLLTLKNPLEAGESDMKRVVVAESDTMVKEPLKVGKKEVSSASLDEFSWLPHYFML